MGISWSFLFKLQEKFQVDSTSLEQSKAQFHFFKKNHAKNKGEEMGGGLGSKPTLKRTDIKIYFFIVKAYYSENMDKILPLKFHRKFYLVTVNKRCVFKISLKSFRIFFSDR